MANYYFEIADSMVHEYGGKYFIASEDLTANFGTIAENTMWDSVRVWCEKEDTVWFIKNKLGLDPRPKVDMKEFMWIKLASKVVNG